MTSFIPRASRVPLAMSGALLASAVVVVATSRAQEYKATLPADHPAIASLAPSGDAVSRLSARMARGDATLQRRPDALGYLPSVLGAFDVPADSQMLVFSKTSVQASRISPEHPRAIYFNDEVAVAHVPGGPGLEVIALDAARGPAFYELADDAAGGPHFTERGTCLRCHHGPNTAGVPGLYVGSVIPGPTGAPLRGESAIITDHATAFQERWGGWYVTARRGEQPDRANAVASNPADPSSLVREARQNLTSLLGLVDPARYLQPTSDIVALMTFEHQTQAVNLITRVAWQARIAEASLPGRPLESRPLAADIAALIDYLLFAHEAPLPEPIEGVSAFTRTFPVRGPRDGQGRSLRDFDLETRLFRYPLSYAIYSPAIDAMLPAVREEIYRQLYNRLAAAPAQGRRLHDEVRRAAIEIVLDTRSGLPDFWRARD